jgi:hypothetical protein
MVRGSGHHQHGHHRHELMPETLYVHHRSVPLSAISHVKGAAAGWRFNYSDRLPVRGDLDPIGAQKASISLCPMFLVLFLKFL